MIEDKQIESLREKLFDAERAYGLAQSQLSEAQIALVRAKRNLRKAQDAFYAFKRREESP